MLFLIAEPIEVIAKGNGCPRAVSEAAAQGGGRPLPGRCFDPRLTQPTEFL